MKALTLWQPWASLVALGHKKVETRCWSTDYRGLIAIHSAKNLPAEWLGATRRRKDFQFELEDIFGANWIDVVSLFPRGSILCIVKLEGIIETRLVADQVTQRDRVFGNYDDGRYAWFLEMVKVFDVPIPVKGNRKLWNWHPGAEAL